MGRAPKMPEHAGDKWHCGFPDEVHCASRPILLSAMEKLQASLAAVREENRMLDQAAHAANEAACRQRERAGKLAVALGKIIKESDTAGQDAWEQGYDAGLCVAQEIAHAALAEYRKGME